MLERRTFLATLTAGMATTILPAGVIAGALNQANQSSASTSMQQRLAPHVGSAFRLKDATGQLTSAVLLSVDEGPRCQGLEQFSIVLEGTDLCDGMYEVCHRDTGILQISLMSSESPATTKVRKRAFFTLFE